jgi:hypothetical protein
MRRTAKPPPAMATSSDGLTPRSRRPVTELLSHLDANWLVRINAIPRHWPCWNYVNTIAWKVPGLRSLRACISQIEVESDTGNVQQIQLIRSRHIVGGAKLYLVCPNCQKHCRFLYMHNYQLSCRRCADCIYISQMRGSRCRARWKAIKIRAKIGQTPAVGSPITKPPFMWRKTFQRYRQIMEQGERARKPRNRSPMYRETLYYSQG